MIDPATFNHQVRDALAHLYDPPHLHTHLLAQYLGDGRDEPREAVLRKALLDAIELLRPPSHVQPEAPVWRRYNILILRYREGLSPEQVAHALKLSERQERRDHQDGVEAISAILWDRLAHSFASERSEAMTSSRQPLPTTDLTTDQVETELLKLSHEHSAEPTDLAETLQSILALIKPLAASQNTYIRMTPISVSVMVRVNRVALRQILLTLLSNSIERNPDCQIVLSTMLDGDSVRLDLQVQPSPPTGQPTPCQSSVPAESRQLRSIAESLAELHGVVIETTVTGNGQITTLTLPSARIVNVLVVDDSPDFVRLFRRYLAGTRYHLFSARTPVGALRLASESHPDVIILDVLMPTQDGWEILTALRSRPDTLEIPIIICSVLPERNLALSLGISDFHSKPVTQRSLLEALEKVSVAAKEPPSRNASPLLP